MTLSADTFTQGGGHLVDTRSRVLLDLSRPEVVLDLDVPLEAPAAPNGWTTHGKRVFDVVAASLLLLIVAPFLAVLVLAIRLTSPGRAIYGNDRVGRDGKPFRCLKFRTMVADADAKLVDLLEQHPALRDEFATSLKLKNDPRVTTIGRFLRRTSLDELPQLWNVLRGDMSLVGPRPVLMVERLRYGQHLSRVVRVRPGLTGPWQVGGRNDLSYRERIALQVGYADDCSFRSDLHILLKTMPALVRKDNGAY